MKYTEMQNKLSVLVLILFFSLSNSSLVAQEYSLGAIPPTVEEYERLPKVDWNILHRNADKKSIAAKSSTAGIVMLNNPEVMAQGSQGSCVGWAIGYAAVGILAYPKYNYNWNLAKRSPSYVFNQIQLGQCSGSYLIDGLNLVKNQGVCSYSMMPYNVTNCTTQPTNTQRLNAISNNVNWGTLVRNDVLGIKQSIDLGYPVIINFLVTETFDNMWNTNGIWNSTNSNDTTRGHHATCVIGYDDNKQMFKVQNSWGKTRGDNGFFWITYNLVQNNSLSGVYVLYGINPNGEPSISGPSHVCPGSTVTFTVNNAPVNYTWGCSSNLTPVSGSLGSFTTSSVGGSAWVSIRINGAEITRKNFTIGSEIDGVEGIYSVLTARYTPEPFCPGQVKMWTLDWQGRLITEKPDTVNGYSVFGMNYVDVKSTSAPGVMTIYDLSLIQENGVTATKWISVRDVKLRLVGSDKPKPIDPFPPIDFLLSPNPATSSVTISLQENEDTKDVQSYSALSRNTLTASYTIQLWNSYSLVKSVQTDLDEYQMDLHGIPAGFYYVLVIKDGQTYRKQLMVK